MKSAVLDVGVMEAVYEEPTDAVSALTLREFVISWMASTMMSVHQGFRFLL